MAANWTPAQKNWKSLIDALLQSSSSASPFGLDELDDDLSDISASLDVQKALLHIEAIYQLASEFEHTNDPRYARVSRFLFHHGYKLSRQLVPESKGKGVLQFKIGLKKKFSEWERSKEGYSDGRVVLNDLFAVYKRELLEDKKTKVEEKKLNLQLLEGVILVVDPQAHRKLDQLKQDAQIPMPSFRNILQLDARGNPRRSLLEVRAAIMDLLDASALPIYEKFQRKPKDILEVLEMIFGFQVDNANNQWEHLVLMLTNSHFRVARDETELCGPACHEVCDKIMQNYSNWCDYLQISNIYQSNRADLKKMLLYTALYLLIWGEAANLRFLPECLCYIFYKMAEKLENILAEKESSEPSNKQTFLDNIRPLYEHLSENMLRGGEKLPYSKWSNYDDFNEYFWSSTCLELVWPLTDTSIQNFTNDRRGDRPHGLILRKKNLFIERRTFLHLYHSFHRLWILLILLFQVMVVIAFSNHLSLDKVKLLLSVGPTYTLMMFIESALDLYMMIGTLTHTQSIVKTRIILCLLWSGGSSITVVYLYLLVLMEEGKRVLGTSVINVYVFLLVIYVACHIVANIFLKIPTFRLWLRTCNQRGIARFVNCLHREQSYVGQRVYEPPFSYIKYALFWMLVLSLKLSFSYFFQVKPLVEPSITIAGYKGFTYHWHDFVSKGNHNALTILTLWAPIVLIYLVDIQIWYTLVSSILGGLIGGKQRLGEIRSLDMLRRHFHQYPRKFMDSMVAPNRQELSHGDGPSSDMRLFATYWNEIIHCLREEDYIENRERDFLLMPEGERGFLLKDSRVIQWPLFLLVGKVSQAVKVAKDHEGNRERAWKEIKKDIYMRSAVLEAYESLKLVLLHFFNEELPISPRDVPCKELPDIVNKASELLDVLMKFLQDDEKVVEVEKSVSIAFDKLKRSCSAWHVEFGNASNKIRRQLTEKHKLRSDIRRLQNLLKGDGSESIPKNLEARRRLEFFANSLFMNMPQAKDVKSMMSFSVITPFCSGDVIYTIEQLNKREDGISLLFYLQKVFPDEWENFLKRLGMTEETLMKRVNQHKNLEIALKLRLWASYRGQTLARTVRGMMYYHKALQLQTQLESSAPEDMAANLKFTYILACEMWAQKQQRQQKRDILDLLKTNKALRVAYIQESDDNDDKNSKNNKEYFSKLIKADAKGREQEIYKIKLPGNPWLGERKSENQNHAIIFTRGDALQSTAVDQDNYFEEALKMRNLLGDLRFKQAPSILGVRTHIYTGSVSSIAWFMSNQEEAWVTLGQRVLANPLKVRMQYGHGDVFDRIFHITRGGISKASRGINSNGDIFAGYNSVLRGGSITHHEYIQIGKGCSVGWNQITMFQAKMAVGSGEQSLSRDLYRLGRLFDFFRMLSFYVSSVGFYVCSMVLVLIIYIFLYGRAYLAFSGIGRYLKDDTTSSASDIILTTELLFQIGIIGIIPIIIERILEEGAFKALVNFVTLQIQLYSVFYTFLLGTWTHYFGRAILHGAAEDRETGSGFVVRHTRFAENYRLYSRSHFVRGLEILMLLVVTITYGFEKSRSTYIILSLASWFLAASWLFAPFLFNPAGFEWQKTVEDFSDWTNWIFYKSGIGVDVNESWETWWNSEQEHIRTFGGRIIETILCLRFFFFQYGVVYQLHVVNRNTSLLVYAYSWLVFFIIVAISKVFTISQKVSVNLQVFLRLVQGIVSMLLIIAIILLVIFTSVSAGDIFALLLAFVPTGWGIISIAIVWKPLVKRLKVWRHVRKMAKFYDVAMGMLLFIPLVFLSWFPFVSTFQTRIMFNQAFSRGLEISLILGGEQAVSSSAPPRPPTSSSAPGSRNHAKYN